MQSVTREPKEPREPKYRPPGIIRADEVYTLSEAMARTGQGSRAFRMARRKGIIRGSDIIAFLDQLDRLDESQE